jgi:microcystin-dependent protein
MSNYNKATNFAVKDTLTSGDPDKVVSGAEIDNEFNSIASAVTSKADKVAAATTDNLAALDANGNLKDSSFPGNATVPSGGIIMWSGLISAIPTGWALCDGSNATPDLRDRFIVGAGSTYSRNDTGGANSVTLTENEMPSHNHSMNSAGNHSHTGTTDTEPDHDHWVNISAKSTLIGNVATKSGTSKVTRDNSTSGLFSKTEKAGAHSHSLDISANGNHSHTINNTGGDGSHENRPPYLALAFIMKL